MKLSEYKAFLDKLIAEHGDVEAYVASYGYIQEVKEEIDGVYYKDDKFDTLYNLDSPDHFPEYLDKSKKVVVLFYL